MTVSATAPKEERHVGRTQRPSAPPLPAAPNPGLTPSQLWHTLTPQARLKTLHTLSRLLAQQLPTSPAAREVTHEPLR
jgi:hypothetical protein